MHHGDVLNFPTESLLTSNGKGRRVLFVRSTSYTRERFRAPNTEHARRWLLNYSLCIFLHPNDRLADPFFFFRHCFSNSDTASSLRQPPTDKFRNDFSIPDFSAAHVFVRSAVVRSLAPVLDRGSSMFLRATR